MKYRLIDLLQPVDGSGRLRVAKVTKCEVVAFTGKFDRVKCTHFCGLKDCEVSAANLSPADCTECYSREITEGELQAEFGQRYAITGGIPRLLSASAAEVFVKNKRSFSLEWKYFRFGERNWGMDIESRKALFLKAMGREREELRNALIFDAGCGSGLLSMEMGDSFGMEVVALDLSTGIEQAYLTNRNPFVYYIQGSVLEPPLRDGVVDYVYCAGVLIHLANTREAFNALVRCLKPGGRYFTWLYHPIERHKQTGDYSRERVYDWLRRRVTSRLPIRVQELLYLTLLLPYFVKRAILNPFSSQKEDRTWREKMQNFIDTMSPVHVNRYTEAEVMGWYAALGCRNVRVAYADRYGIGFSGDVPTDLQSCDAGVGLASVDDHSSSTGDYQRQYAACD
jgi:SAM-dependent methyltransferase/uncharacterized protein YbaR (Trm112 family)